MSNPAIFALLQAPATPTTPTTPSTPTTPPTATTTGTEVYVVQSPGAAPMSMREIQALKARRSEISTQLESASSRREELAGKLDGMDGAARAGIVERIALLDKRILTLESELDATGRILSSAPAGLAASTRVSSVPFQAGIDSNTVAAIGTTFTVFVLGPIAFSAARLIWKRGNVPPRPAQSPENAQRLDRIEQAVDAIAIEVERVSEGQRFMTRLLAEGHQFPGIGDPARAADPVPASRSSSER